ARPLSRMSLAFPLRNRQLPGERGAFGKSDRTPQVATAARRYRLYGQTTRRQFFRLRNEIPNRVLVRARTESGRAIESARSEQPCLAAQRRNSLAHLRCRFHQSALDSARSLGAKRWIRREKFSIFRCRS